MPKRNILSGEFFDDMEVEAAPVPGTEARRLVPNVFPKITNVPYRIAIIGEAPGKDEEDAGIPFVGWSGQELNRHLSRFNVARDACFIGNVCQVRPYQNKIANFDWNGHEIQSGLTQLRNDLLNFSPNIVLCLGGSALHAFKCPAVVPKKRKTKDGLVFVFPNSISDWRGSFFVSSLDSAAPSTKVISSYHPAACLRNFEWTPYLLMDIQRCAQEATTRELKLPERTFDVNMSFEQTQAALEKVLSSPEVKIGTDIEGYYNNWKCISFAPRPDYAFIVPWVDMQGKSYWTVDQEVVLLDLVTKILSSPHITKTWQNGLYDRFVLQYGYKIVVRGPSHDIMLKTWELYCELEKALSVQCSIYTREPYYKSDINSDSCLDFWRYCCKDSAVTIEIDQKLDKYLKPESQRHYEFNVALLNSLLYMELRGLKYDSTAARRRHAEIQHTIWELQADLDKIAGKGLKTTDKTLLRALLRDKMCYKRDSSRVKADFVDVFDGDMRILLGDADLSKAEIGRLASDMELCLNVKGDKLKKYLYDDLQLPKQYDPTSGALTADYEALLTLTKKSTHPALPIVIAITELRTRLQMLGLQTDPDGRIRTSYNEVGGKTGRVTSLESPTGSGYNLQTIPDENEIKKETDPLRQGMRDLVIADEGCYLAKCDLRGADGWTIGANLASLGDSTMLDDLLFGLKPAAILCFAFRHGIAAVVGKSRGELSGMLREVKKSDWDYFAFKQYIWGCCYLMGVRKAAQHIFNLSEGTVQVSESDMEKVKNLVMQRYNVALWWRAVERKLFDQPYPPRLTSPSGHTRIFFGRRSDILGQALAHEPQSVTTYATNQAVYRCWTDPENRIQIPSVHSSGRSRTSLRVEPLHQVHDEFLCQFHIEDTEWATKKIKEWFNNEIVIAGVKVTIPFEGTYGTNWAMNEASKKGVI